MKIAYEFSRGILKSKNVNKIKEKPELVYSICYYADRDHNQNILRQISQADSLVNDTGVNLVFIAVCAFDDLSKDHVESTFQRICEQIENNKKYNIIFFPVFNWGGTIAALWHLWSDLINKSKIETKYVSHMEEDIRIFSNSWYESSKSALHDFVYVGETTLSAGEFKRTPNRGTTGGPKGRKKLSDTETWTDGGFYFTTPEKLKKMEEVIGVFHKGDQITKWDHHLDGVDLGEVGFPTLLYDAGLRFTSLARSSFFDH